MRMTRLKIGAHTYPLNTKHAARLGDDGNWAEHDGRNRVIYIDTLDRPPSAIAEDLVHEVLHALFLDAGRIEIDNDDEERLVTLLAPRLTAFIADNPEVIRELAKMLKP